MRERGVTCREDHDIGLKEGAICESDTVFLKVIHLLTLLDLDFAINDQVRAANVDVIPLCSQGTERKCQ